MANSPPDAYRRLVQECRRIFEADALLRPHADYAFEVKETIGAGGMATVYRAYDHRTRREAALKVLKSQLGDPKITERFVREARVTALLDHPSIPPVYEYGRNGRGELYMLMKLIQGRTLRERLRRFQREGQPEAELSELLGVLIRVCEALSYAHERGVIHRDIKPDNIMIGPHGEVYLMDWGLARELHENREASSTTIADSVFEDELSRGGQVVGTFAYMSPEQARGAAVDHRADLFGVGALLFEILTGDPPHPGPGLAGQAQAVEGRIRVPREARRRAPARLLSLAQSCLHKDPGRRPPDARELATALRGHRARPPRRRPALLPWALLALSVLGLAALAWERQRLDRRATELESRIAAAEAPAAKPEEKPDPAPVRPPPSAPKPVEESPRTGQRRAARMISEAEALTAAGKARDATLILGQVLNSEPRNARAESALGRAIFQTGDIEGALARFTRAIELDPARSDGFNERGVALHRLGRHEDALADYDRALALEADNVAVLTNRASVLSDLGRIEEALADYAAALAINDRLSTVYNNRGNLLRRLRRFDEAIRDFDRAIELEPRYARAWYNRGLAKQKQGLLEEAILDYSRCVELNDRYTDAYNNRGNCRKNLGRKEEALADYSAALRVNPRYAGAYVNRGKLLFELGHRQQARGDLEKFLELAPNHPSASIVRRMLER